MIYDMLIIGGGPAGYTAALYAARAGLKAVVLEKGWAGGQMAVTHRIENYPGLPEGVDGTCLSRDMQRGAEQFGAKTVNEEVTRLALLENPKTAETTGGIYQGRTVILATGASARELGLPEEKALVGRGVSYCAHCDGLFYKGKTVLVAGGGNSAAGDALLLSRVAQRVLIVHRRDTMRAEKAAVEALEKADNVEFIWDTRITALLGRDRLTGVAVENLKTREKRDIICQGLFVSIGRRPASDLVAGQLNLDEQGYVVAGENTKTNIAGVYAAGDVRAKELRQIVTATADGASAVHQAELFLNG